MIRRLMLALALLGAAPAAFAQGAWPARPLRIVVPYPPGGASDSIARLLQAPLGAALGQPVIVENRAGAGSLIGTEAVVRAAPDGLTLLLADVALAMLPALAERMPYDTEADLAPVALLGLAPQVLLVRQGLPARTLGDLVALARARPEAVSLAAAGPSGQIVGALFQEATGTRFNGVTYRGAAPVLTDLAGGTIDAGFATLATALPALTAGQVRALAVLSDDRAAIAPAVPTLREEGHPLSTAFWFGLLVPAETPREIVARLAAAVAGAMSTPDLAARLPAMGITPRVEGQAGFAALIRTDIARFAAVAQARGIRAQ